VFVKLLKATFSFVVSVRPSFGIELGSNWKDFYKILHLVILGKSGVKIQT